MRGFALALVGHTAGLFVYQWASAVPSSPSAGVCAPALLLPFDDSSGLPRHPPNRASARKLSGGLAEGCADVGGARGCFSARPPRQLAIPSRGIGRPLCWLAPSGFFGKRRGCFEERWGGFIEGRGCFGERGASRSTAGRPYIYERARKRSAHIGKSRCLRLRAFFAAARYQWAHLCGRQSVEGAGGGG